MNCNINFDYITDYIRSNISGALLDDDDIIKNMKNYAENHDIPISQPETIRFIEVLCSIAKFKKVLEIGTAIGYSTILIAAACGSESEVDSIEIREDMVKLARENIAKARLKSKISIYHGDAKEILPNLEAKYDMIFIDAAKGQYLKFLSHCLELLSLGGVLISDNVLYQGMIANDRLVKRRKITIVKRMRQYINELCKNPKLKTSLLPLGDGVAISCKILR